MVRHPGRVWPGGYRTPSAFAVPNLASSQRAQRRVSLTDTMSLAATRDTDFWLLFGIYILAALVLAYWVPRLLGLILYAPFRAFAEVRSRGRREPL